MYLIKATRSDGAVAIVGNKNGDPLTFRFRDDADAFQRHFARKHTDVDFKVIPQQEWTIPT